MKRLLGLFCFLFLGLHAIALAETLEYQESPLLSELVKAGKLPSVEQRLPVEPLVIKPVSEVGVYGGTWHSGFTGPADGQNMARIVHDHLLFWNNEVTQVVPQIAKSWDISTDGKIITFHLRTGLKWSDGSPFNADDILFWYEDLFLNDELNPTKASWMSIGGARGKVEKIDNTTLRFTFAAPYRAFIDAVASLTVSGHFYRGGEAMGLYAPKHYMKQFHPRYTPLADLEKKAKNAGLTNWAQLFKLKNNPMVNPDCPTMAPWRVVTPINSQQMVMERNPYYYAIDTAGNQLPYIDKLVFDLAENLEVINLKALQGLYDFQVRHIDITKVPVFKQNQEKGGYTVKFWRWPHGSDAGLYFNQSYRGDKELESWLQNKEFRKALSLSIERTQLNEVFWLGLGMPGSGAPSADSPYFLGPESLKQNAVLDVATANQILDGLGLKKNAEGFRQRLDGKGQLILPISTIGATHLNFTGIANMINEQWEKNVGIKSDVREMERGLGFTKLQNNELEIMMWSNDGTDNPFTYPFYATTFSPLSPQGPFHGLWWDSAGTKGIKPEGDLMKQLDLFTQGLALAPEQRIEIGKSILRLGLDNLWTIGTVGNSPAFMGVAIVKNTMHNVPDKLVGSTPAQTPSNAHPEQFYIK